ncbi:MAG: chaperonin GroEL [Oscillospiraceae bacterium]|nr:chaperonin GroEL [Oscillospiraceae bacterium]
MSYINPKIKAQFETLPIDLKNAILEQNVQLNTMNDLIKCLESIATEG